MKKNQYSLNDHQLCERRPPAGANGGGGIHTHSGGSHEHNGCTTVVTVQDPDMERSAATITCHGINYFVENKKSCGGSVESKHILQDITGIFKPGMNAILGPTGSGKTSLLDVISGRKDPRGLSGTLLVDGNKQPENFKCMTGYVVQDDVVMGTLTIRENIMFSANLRLPSHISKQDKEARVTNLLHELGLSHCADSKVGNEFIRGISGGERKRTNIGMELIIAPPVLFLDEPTTGLDASTANSVMLLLHRLSRKGKTIVFSLHQPRYSIFKLFDNLLLLALGKTVYHGPADDALQYFSSIGYECEEHNNPPDFFLDVINGDSTCVNHDDEAVWEDDVEMSVLGTEDQDTLADSLAVKYRDSSYHSDMRKNVDPVEAGYQHRLDTDTAVVISRGQYAVGFCSQFNYVSRRAALNIARNPQTSFVQFFIVAVFGTIVGLIYLQVSNMLPAAIQNRVGALFFIIMNQVFSNLSAIELFIKERAIFIHENSSGFYRVSAYFCSKVLCDIVPLRAIPVIMFSIISYFMIGFQMDVGKFFFYMLNLFLTTTAAAGIGFLMSASFRVFAIANLMSALTFVLMMVFSGLLVNLATMASWISWLQYLSIFRYSLNALSINELKDIVLCTEISIENFTQTICGNTSGNAYLDDQGIAYGTTWDLWLNEVALFIIGTGFMICTWLRLVFVNKMK